MKIIRFFCPLAVCVCLLLSCAVGASAYSNSVMSRAGSPMGLVVGGYGLYDSLMTSCSDSFYFYDNSVFHNCPGGSECTYYYYYLEDISFFNDFWFCNSGMTVVVDFLVLEPYLDCTLFFDFSDLYVSFYGSDQHGSYASFSYQLGSYSRFFYEDMNNDTFVALDYSRDGYCYAPWS